MKILIFICNGDGGVYISGSVSLITLNGDTWVNQGSSAYPNGYRLALLSEVCYTTVDIYSDVNKSNITLEGSESFFPQPPATLEEIMKQEAEQKATMQEILGILPMILSVLVSLLALRKALRMLLTLLHQS